MSGKIPVFRSPESEAQYCQAYEAALMLWPVPYDEFYVSTRFVNKRTLWDLLLRLREPPAEPDRLLSAQKTGGE